MKDYIQSNKARLRNKCIEFERKTCTYFKKQSAHENLHLFHVQKQGIYQNKKQLIILISDFSKDEEYKDSKQNSTVYL